MPFFKQIIETVNLNFKESTGVNSYGQFQFKKLPKNGWFYMCPPELNVCSFRVVDRSQNSLDTAIRIWAAFSLDFRSIAFIVFDC